MRTPRDLSHSPSFASANESHTRIHINVDMETNTGECIFLSQSDVRRCQRSSHNLKITRSHFPYQRITMMRIFFCLAIAMAPTFVWSAAFVSSARPFATSRLAASQAEEHLNEMANAWTELQKKEKEVERTKDEVS